MSTQPPQWGPPSPNSNPYPPAAPAQNPYPGGYPQQAPAGYGYPAAAPAPGYPQHGAAHFGLSMKRRNAWGVWLGLPLITIGIYGLVWYYKIHKEMAEFDSRRKISPGGSLLTMIFGGYLLIPPFVSFYNTGKRIADAQRAAGLQPTCSGGLGLLLCFVLGLGSFYYQNELNKVVDRYGQIQPGTQVPLAA
ncbi:DUF4234 domain-containing protein [Streptomyces triculaminicus]|uniref:DUF4234 domain-containing protein n=1 Tax=Streptomyces triculaminicus TaxID=2816232 RepID=UPI0037D477F0